ncbi:hypothetical protein F5B18DRAFT_437736 [Nemania serpens]|nr:hypothetical protein F5B18DRAFT_437736 [Nemania serpens]
MWPPPPPLNTVKSGLYCVDNLTSGICLWPGMLIISGLVGARRSASRMVGALTIVVMMVAAVVGSSLKPLEELGLFTGRQRAGEVDLAMRDQVHPFLRMSSSVHMRPRTPRTRHRRSSLLPPRPWRVGNGRASPRESGCTGGSTESSSTRRRRY